MSTEKLRLLDDLAVIGQYVEVVLTMNNEVWNRCFTNEEPNVLEYRCCYKRLCNFSWVESEYLSKVKESLATASEALARLDTAEE